MGREDLPMDLMVKMDLEEITPFPMTVPCLDGVGSCEYDVCAILDNANGQEGDSVTLFLSPNPAPVPSSREKLKLMTLRCLSKTWEMSLEQLWRENMKLWPSFTVLQHLMSVLAVLSSPSNLNNANFMLLINI